MKTYSHNSRMELLNVERLSNCINVSLKFYTDNETEIDSCPFEVWLTDENAYHCVLKGNPKFAFKDSTFCFHDADVECPLEDMVVE